MTHMVGLNSKTSLCKLILHEYYCTMKFQEDRKWSEQRRLEKVNSDVPHKAIMSIFGYIHCILIVEVSVCNPVSEPST